MKAFALFASFLGQLLLRCLALDDETDVEGSEDDHQHKEQDCNNPHQEDYQS